MSQPASYMSGSGQPPGNLPLDEAALLTCRSGELEAFGELVRLYQDRVYNSLLRMCGNAHDAEELSQEAFVKAFESLHGFRADSGFYTWIFRIAVNLALSRRRRAKKVKFHSLDGPEDQGLDHILADGRQEDPAALVGREDLHRHVLQELAGLDDDYKIVLVLRDIEGMDYQQIAHVLALPLGTVKSRLFRGRSILQEKLQHLL